MPAVPFVVVKLPPSALEEFPSELVQALNEQDPRVETLQLLLMLHPAVNLGRSDQVNLMPHAWALRHLEDLGAIRSTDVHAGVFPLDGAFPVDGASRFSGTAPFGQLQSRMAFVHDGCFSPDNLQLRVDTRKRLIGFYSAVALGGHGVAALHMLPIDEPTEDELRKVVAEAPDAAKLQSSLPGALGEVGAPAAGAAVSALLGRLLSAGEDVAAAYEKSTVTSGTKAGPLPGSERRRGMSEFAMARQCVARRSAQGNDDTAWEILGAGGHGFA